MEYLTTHLAFLILGALNPQLFEFVDKLYIKNRIQDYFGSTEFQVLWKKFLLWSWDCDPDKTLRDFLEDKKL